MGNDKYYLQSGACTQTCQGATYADDATSSCVSCSDPDAATCSSTAATSCNTLYLKDGACTKDCGDGLFADANKHVCSSCSDVDAHAATCTSTKATSCKTLYLTEDGACSKDCGDTYYNDDPSKTCIACADTDAITCDATQALSCKSGFFLNNGQCVSPCPSGSYGDSTTATCKSCSAFPDAATCESTGALTCKTAGNVAVNKQCVPGNAYALYPGYVSYGPNGSWDYGQYYSPAPSHPTCASFCEGMYPGGATNTFKYKDNNSFGYCFCLASTSGLQLKQETVFTSYYFSAAQFKGTCAALNKGISSCVDVTFAGGSCTRTSDGSNCDYLY